MGKRTTYDYTDLLTYASANKIADWNEAIDLFKEARIIPFYEHAVRYLDENEYEGKVKEIIEGFMKKEGIEELIVIDN